MISYDGLYEQLRNKGITKTDLTVALGISSRTIAKIAKGEKLSRNTLQKIGWITRPGIAATGTSTSGSTRCIS